ncbi:MAG: thiamine-phosphate kinase [Sulfurimonas sp.]|nr:thiamine-phosphate kinase [Sulfurimonas sp.]MBU1216282.1 thiamine-phosphate kinase [bacterium]MBU1434588.1 thiamine-phosphate kinase [bacterium]MBU1502166.1 thiamine-phosphate kinase [bacterium]MBU3938908.1 thiamine-phosphate kinase [bacterium]
MNLENYFIAQFNSKRIGDDGAVIGNFVYSKDAFFEDIHFKKKWMTHYQIAKKSMLVNISDAIAMNAKPKYALLAVAMPKNITKKQMRELVHGFEDAAKIYGVEIIGGDTVSNSKIDITVTIISEVKKPLLRSGLKKDYLLAYTGSLGSSLKELRKLSNLGKIHKQSKFVDIRLRQKFVQNAGRFLSSGMDISDGLFSDLQKLSDVNRIGFRFHKKIAKCIGCSGEEYEMLVAFRKKDKKTVLRRAAMSRVKLNIFATSTRVKYTNRCKSHHF